MKMQFCKLAQFFAFSLIVLLNPAWARYHAQKQEVLIDDKGTDTPGNLFEREKVLADVPRIAIIGSGITGAVTAFNIYENSRLSETGPPIITIFEKNPIIGGRITTSQVYGDPRLTIDTCARTFAPSIDVCIGEAARQVGLTVTVDTDLKVGTGLWDGTRFVGYIEDDDIRSPASWTLAKQLRWFQRYGDAPTRLESEFSNILTARYGQINSFSSIHEEINRTRLESFLENDIRQQTTLNITTNEKDKLYLQEVIQASTRQRFFGNLNELNALDTILGLYASSRSNINGGNLRLIDRLIKLSGAQVHINTTVTEITTDKSQKWQIETLGPKTKRHIFDNVVVAAPFALSNIALSMPLNMSNIPNLTYVDTIVTHFTTTNLLNATYFNTSEAAPQNILTTVPDSNTNSPYDNTLLPPFFSLTLISNRMVNPKTRRTEFLYKIVSRSILSDDEISQFINRNESVTEPAISWIDRQVLPLSVPRLQRGQIIQDKLEIAPGLYYAGGGEQIASQIETGCRVGRSVANLAIPSR